MAMRHWLVTVLKVVVMGVTMCSGIIVANTTCLSGMRATKEGGVLGRPTRR